MARRVLVDLATRRRNPDDSEEPVFRAAYQTVRSALGQAVERARAALRDDGKDTDRLDGYSWHGNRHTFASRLVMAGVDLRTVQELGGWRTLAMVLRYSHLAPAHLHAAVERLVTKPAREPPAGVELGRDFDFAGKATGSERGSVS